MDEQSRSPSPHPSDIDRPSPLHRPHVKQEDDDFEIIGARPVHRAMSIDARPAYAESEVSDTDSVPSTPMRTHMRRRSAAESHTLRMPRTPHMGVLSRFAGCTEAVDSARKTKGKGSGVPSTPMRQRKAPAKTPTTGTRISTSFDDLSEEDYLLIEMKDSGKGWEEIRAAWRDLTGQETAKSTLPNRYSRLKANLSNLSDQDLQNLVDAKAEVELEFEQEMWGRIQQRMAEKGTVERHNVDFLKKQLKRVEVFQHTAAGRTARGIFESLAALPGDMDTAE